MENHLLRHTVFQQLKPMSKLATFARSRSSGSRSYNSVIGSKSGSIMCEDPVTHQTQKKKYAKCTSSSTTSKTLVDPNDENCATVSKNDSESAGLGFHKTNHQELLSNEAAAYKSTGNREVPDYATKSILHQAQFRRSRGNMINTMLHKAYLNLKKKQLHLLYEQQNQRKNTKQALEKDTVSQAERTESDIESCPFSHPSNRTSSSLNKSRWNVLNTCRCEEFQDNSRVTDDRNIKQQFYDTLFLKYQDPTPEEVKKLSVQFPEPEKLFRQVVKPLCEAYPKCKPRLVITDHLQQHYWKAQLTLPWSSVLTVKGVHPDRDQAIKGAYWLMCERLMLMAFIFQNEDGIWVPMTCDKVVTMLETLSKYGESLLGNSRGRGFKIILEQVKDQETVESAKNSLSDFMTSKEDSLGPDQSMSDTYLESRRETEMNENIGLDLDEYIVKRTEKEFHSETSTFSAGTDSMPSSLSDVEYSNFSPNDCDKESASGPVRTTKANSKLKWFCTVHVGWPFPFTVEAEGVSLPSAQMMGYIAVANKLKAQNLLTLCNNAVSCHILEKYVARHTISLWEKSIISLWDTEAIEKFNASAEVFCDASTYGFGAYLLLNDTKKVSWISETWQNFGMSEKQMLFIFDGKFLQSTIAELFAIVTAVFSWKQKLRSRRVLCFSDNMTITGFINSFSSELVEPDKCLTTSDHLICILHSTCLHYNIEIQATWLERDKNWLADCLSRSDINTFRAAVPGAGRNKTSAKKLILKNGTYTDDNVCSKES